MLHLDRRFLLEISGQLRNFVQKDQSLYNASCPICGDSKKNTTRARLYFYTGKENTMMVKCHNCGYIRSFGAFLKQLNPQKHREYVMERFKSSAYGRYTMESVELPAKVKVEEVERTFAVKRTEFLTSIDDLSSVHPARLYCEGRRIPHYMWKDLYYCNDFKEYMVKNYPEFGEKYDDGDKRLCWFNTDLDGRVNQICARSLAENPKARYIKRKLNKDNERRVYGLHNIHDWFAPIYVVEGEIDAMMFPNFIASGDSSMKGLAEAFAIKHQDISLKLVIIFDNQPYNKDIVRLQEQAIRGGHWVVVWDSNKYADYKDINAVVCADKGDGLLESFKARTYKGIEAQLRFNEWRKCG